MGWIGLEALVNCSGLEGATMPYISALVCDGYGSFWVDRQIPGEKWQKEKQQQNGLHREAVLLHMYFSISCWCGARDDVPA